MSIAGTTSIPDAPLGGLSRGMSTPKDSFPFLHPKPMSLSDIPWHASHSQSSDAQENCPDRQSFIRHVLDQSREWMATRMPWSQPDIKTASARPSRAQVQVCSQEVRYGPDKNAAQNGGLFTDHWFGRRSVHENVPEKGTASFEELEALLKKDHAENEMLYNSSVIKVDRVMEYDMSKIDIGGGWTDVTAFVNVLIHKYPMLTRRCYTVLEVTATLPPATASSYSPADSSEQGPINSDIPAGNDALTGFIIIQIPLRYSEISKPARAEASSCISAHYVSIEMVRTLAQPSGVGRKPQIEWTMATAAHAGGWIPEAVQRSWSLGGVPKQIVKDVGFVVGYLAKERARREGTNSHQSTVGQQNDNEECPRMNL